MADLLEDIRSVVGENGIITGEAVHERPADWLGRTNCTARALVRPASTQEVSRVLALCNETGQTVVPAGGLTGLVHGTDAGAGDLVLSLERMSAVEDIDPLGKTMTVQAGAKLQSVQEAADEAGLCFALDLGARGSCAIGGNISTNAGGNQVIRYGMMREQVLGLEAVLADGTVLSSMNTLLKNNTGFDLKQLFIGGEGALGVVTRAVLRLRPKPISRNTAFIGVESFDAVTKLFALMGEKLAGSLSAFEVMWRDFYHLIAFETGNHTPPLPDGFSHYVIVETEGADPERDADQFSAALEAAVEEELAADAVIAQSDSQRQAIWAIREDVVAFMGALWPLFVFDVSMPMRHMNDYVETLSAALKEKWDDKARMVVFGHIGDGNLHIAVTVGSDDDDARKAVEELVYSPLEAIGGSVSAEHGIGLEKKKYLRLSRSPEELATMRAIKRALDPNNILNPGKVFDL
ncbi:MAG: FAD-binding oxidoreductase [Parvularculaceae bacterium]